MPRGDRTGPAGMGPRSGRAAGYCGGFEMPGYANPGSGPGPGWGYGPGGGRWGRRFGAGRRGFGGDWRPWGGGFCYGFDAEMDRQALRSRADALRAELGALESRLADSEEKKEKPE